MTSAPRFLLALAALVVVAVVAENGLRIGRADAAVFEVTREMSTWSAAGSRSSAQTADWLKSDLGKALERIPGDPKAHELWGVLGTMNPESPEFPAESLVHFGKALERRPTSPYTWAFVAQVRYRTGDTGPEFVTALRRAASLGPAEPEVQRIVADYGLAVWDELGTEARTVVGRSLQSGFTRNPLEMLQIAQRRGRLDVACRHWAAIPRAGDSKWKNLCVGTEASQ